MEWDVCAHGHTCMSVFTLSVLSDVLVSDMFVHCVCFNDVLVASHGCALSVLGVKC